MSYQYIVFGNGHEGTIIPDAKLREEYIITPKEMVTDRDEHSTTRPEYKERNIWPVRKLVAHGHTYLVVSENEISQEQLEAALLSNKQSGFEVKPFE